MVGTSSERLRSLDAVNCRQPALDEVLGLPRVLAGEAILAFTSQASACQVRSVVAAADPPISCPGVTRIDNQLQVS